jgi:transposase
LDVEYLPPYAPELNPVEYIWAHCKHHELPNVCAKNLWDLGEGARRSLRRMRRRPRLITALWKQVSLFGRFRYITRNSVGAHLLTDRQGAGRYWCPALRLFGGCASETV